MEMQKKNFGIYFVLSDYKDLTTVIDCALLLNLLMKFTL